MAGTVGAYAVAFMCQLNSDFSLWCGGVASKLYESCLVHLLPQCGLVLSFVWVRYIISLLCTRPRSVLCADSFLGLMLFATFFGSTRVACLSFGF